MLQALERTRIWTDGVGYDTPTPGSLACLPLQEQFCQPQGDVHACISVCIDFETTMRTPKPSPVIRAPDALSAAPRTCLACVLSFDGSYLNAVLPSHAFKGNSKYRVGHPLDLAVRFAIEPRILESVEVFDGYGRLILLCENNNLVHYLVASRLIEVLLVSLKFPERSSRSTTPFVCLALQLAPSNADVTFSPRDVSVEIKLLQNPASADNGDGCQTRRTYIHPNYRLPSPRFFNGNFSPEVNYENPALAPSLEAELGEGVPLREQGFESEICTVLFNWQTDALDAIEGGNAEDWVAAFGFGNLSAPRHIVINYGFGESLSVPPILPDSVHCFDEYLALNWEFISDNMVGGLV